MAQFRRSSTLNSLNSNASLASAGQQITVSTPSLGNSRRSSKRRSISKNSELRFSIAQQELLNTVDGILERTVPVKAAVAHIERLNKEIDQGVATVAPSAVDSAVEILTECFQRRLREAAETAIYAGRNHITKEDVDDVSTAVQNAKDSGFLDNKLDLTEFERLAKNLDAKWLATRVLDPRDPPQAKKLTGLLQRHLYATEADLHTMMTDATLAEIAQTLLWMIVANQKSCDAVIRTGIVDIAAQIMLGPANEHDAKNHPTAEIPELQLRLCHLLAGVVIRAVDDEDKTKQTAKVAGAFLGKLLRGAAGGGSPHTAEGEKAVKYLLRIMKEKMEINEHGGVWSAVRALHIIALRPTGGRKILMVEGLPMIQKAYAYYRSLRFLPPATERKPPEGPRISYSAPSLIAFPTPPALYRTPPGVMETLRKEEALANPQKTIKRKTLLDIGPDQTGAATDDAHEYSLFGLLKEDDADQIEPLAFFRVTDRNIMVLKLHYLERAVQKASTAMKAPFARKRSGVSGAKSIEADKFQSNTTGGTDMAPKDKGPAFLRTETEKSERRTTFVDIKDLGQESESPANAMRRSFGRNVSESRMSLVH